jgi:hypothetical protein
MIVKDIAMNEYDLNKFLNEYAEQDHAERTAAYVEYLDEAWVEHMEEQNRQTSYGFDW